MFSASLVWFWGKFGTAIHWIVEGCSECLCFCWFPLTLLISKPEYSELVQHQRLA